MKYILNVKCRNVDKALNDLPKHCWILTAWDYSPVNPYQVWWNEITDITMKLFII